MISNFKDVFTLFILPWRFFVKRHTTLIEGNTRTSFSFRQDAYTCQRNNLEGEDHWAIDPSKLKRNDVTERDVMHSHVPYRLGHPSGLNPFPFSLGNLWKGHEVLKKIENARDSDEWTPVVTMKIINCGEYYEDRLRFFFSFYFTCFFFLFVCLCQKKKQPWCFDVDLS